MRDVLASMFVRTARMIAQAPTAPDTDDVAVRAGRRGELYSLPLWNKMQGLADEGALFAITNPTPGTGIATIAALTSLVDTAPFILIKNNNPTGGKRVYLERIRLQVTAPGTAGAQLRAAIKTDVQNPLKYTSGATMVAVVPNNVNPDDDQTSGAQVWCGPIVAAAAAGAKLIDHVLVRPVIPVIGDTYSFNFGSLDESVGSLLPSGTAVADRVFNFPACPIGPQQWAAFHIWLPSQSAASSYEPMILISER